MLKAEEVFLAIRRLILERVAEPGTRIMASDVARQFRVAPINASDAVARLMVDGYAATGRSVGYVIARFDEASIRETFTLKTMVDPKAVALVASTAGPEQLVPLMTAHDAMKAALAHEEVDADTLTRAMMSFDTEMMMASGNRMMIQTGVRGMRPSLFRWIARASDREAMVAACRHRRTILEAIEVKDSDYAAAAAQVSISRDMHLLIDFVTNQPTSYRSDWLSATPGEQGEIVFDDGSIDDDPFHRIRSTMLA